MRNHKLFFSLSFAVILLMSSLTGVSAQSVNNSATDVERTEKSVYKLKLDGLTVETPYSPDLYNFLREESENSVKVTVVEKSSGKTVSAYGEIVEYKEAPNKLHGEVTPLGTGTYTTRTTYRTYYDQGYNGLHFAGANLYTVYTCWQDGSFGQINSVEDTYWSPVPGTGNFELESPHATTVPTGSTNKFPTNKMTTTGTVVFKTTSKEAFNVNLKFFGFTLGSDSINRYAITSAGYNITFGR
ncbi:hypothetical protein GNQ08_00460 [Paenibacillus macerans]|uniref:Uncharacterized protein n=1 Tax=Paenibacillus macerans TaxID=44252 RepID=A0A090Y9D6_PAEMA|nr:hypothetical protein [Paenibacillus macerans]KFM94437.1 hypothetical protein DJ90_1141 [Paenibacillus macerans]MCY7561183.1 hypothetical protein [Paenibacillus macerans]MEC0152142.1 hypothetical protein [Paenibacillus macerans]MED4957053.1 hypothetical protein [Paenibacillus macerans]MUG20914.1 hypothetical protein [Paenibacillus macerans]